MVAMLVGGAALVRLVLSSMVPLFPDEAYYWLWSRRIEAGYFDHPPGVAWLIAAGTGILGDTLGGVRFGPLVAALLTHVAAVLAAWQLAGRGARGLEAAWRAALLIAVLPMAMLGLVIATPDAALFVVVMLAVLAVERALASPVRSQRSFAWWTAAGSALGLAFVSKYTAVLLPAGLVLAFAVHPALRQRFREIGPWWGAAIALALFSPVVAWNYLNDWISFRFQLGHGFGTTAPGSVLGRELELLGGQLGLMSPILFGLMMVAAWRALRDGWRVRHQASPTDLGVRRFALSLLAFVPLAFFAISAVRRSVEPNWPALMYPSAILLLATDTAVFARPRWWKAGLWVAGIILAVGCVQVWRPALPVAPRRDPIARAFGWDSVAAAVDEARRDPFLDGTVDRWVAAERYQEASVLAFYLEDHPPVFSLNLNGRTNQFDLWETAYEKIRPGDGLIAVFDDNPAGDALAAKVGSWFRETRGGAHVVLRREGGEVAHRRIWLYRIAHDVPPRAKALPALSATR